RLQPLGFAAGGAHLHLATAMFAARHTRATLSDHAHPFGVDEGIVPTLAQELVARHAVQRLHAVTHPELIDAAIGREAVFEDVPGRHRRDTSIPELGEAQRLLRLLAGTDIAANADHAYRGAIRIPLDDLAPLEQPLPAALAIP